MGGVDVEAPVLTVTISVLICDDHLVLAETLAAVFAEHEVIRLAAGPVGDPERAVEICAERRPDVVLMDIRFRDADLDGIDATRRIAAVSPRSKVVILTAHAPEEFLVTAVEAGATGFLSKTAPIEQVEDAVLRAARGEVLIDPGTLALLVHRAAEDRGTRERADRVVSRLTRREREVLQLVADGLPNARIAERLYVAPRTVETHIGNIVRKLETSSKLQAVLLAARHGVVSI